MTDLSPILRMKKSGTWIVRTGRLIQKSGFTLAEWKHVETHAEAEKALGIGVQLKCDLK